MTKSRSIIDRSKKEQEALVQSIVTYAADSDDDEVLELLAQCITRMGYLTLENENLLNALEYTILRAGIGPTH